MINNLVHFYLFNSGFDFFFRFSLSSLFTSHWFSFSKMSIDEFSSFLAFSAHFFFSSTCLDVLCSFFSLFWRNSASLRCNECKAFEFSAWPVAFMRV